MKYILNYLWEDSTGFYEKKFYLNSVVKAVILATMIADSDLNDNDIKSNAFELLVDNNGELEEWEGENGESFEDLF